MRTKEQEDREWMEQCEDQLARSFASRIRYGFCHVYRPVLDDEPVRAFRTMAEYRRWAHENLPDYLGFRIVEKAGNKDAG